MNNFRVDDGGVVLKLQTIYLLSACQEQMLFWPQIPSKPKLFPCILFVISFPPQCVKIFSCFYEMKT